MDFRISDKGKLVKSSKVAKEIHATEFGCTNCGNTYEAIMDDKRRYVRGEITRKGF